MSCSDPTCRGEILPSFKLRYALLHRHLELFVLLLQCDLQSATVSTAGGVTHHFRL